MTSETDKPPNKVPNTIPTSGQSDEKTYNQPSDRASAERNFCTKIIADQNAYNCKNYRLQRWYFWVQFAVFVVASCAAGAAIYYACIAHKQWEVMNETYGEIRTQTTFSKESADAARRAADAAKNEVKVARDTLEAQKQSVQSTLTEMKAQSKTTQISADAAQSAANTASSQLRMMQTDQRAWINVRFDNVTNPLVVNKTLGAVIHISNVGKTPDRKVHSIVIMENVKSAPSRTPIPIFAEHQFR